MFLKYGTVLSGSKFYSAWYLSQIIGENGYDTLKFIYESNSEIYTTRIKGNISTTVGSMPSNTTWELLNVGGFSNSMITHSVLHLKEITYNGLPIKIHFKTSEREDLKGGRKLDQLVVSYNNDTINYFRFYFSNFSTTWEKTEIQPDRIVNVLNPLHKRLKLLSIQKFGRNYLTKESPYQFTYYHDDRTNSKLPYRNCTNGFDHWGYFNSELSNEEDVNEALKSFPKKDGSTNFPTNNQIGLHHVMYSSNQIGTVLLTSTSAPTLLAGGNRMPNEYAKALSLKSIIYPTGGKTMFYYENNQYTSVGNSTQMGIAGGLRIKRIVDEIENDSIIKEYDYQGGVVYSTPNYLYSEYDALLGTATASKYKLNNFSTVSAYSYGEMIAYVRVTEKYIDSKTNEQYQTVFSYYSANDYNPNYYEKAGLLYWYAYFFNTDEESPYKSSNLVQSSNSYRTILRPFDGLILGKSYRHGLIKSIKYYSGTINNIVLKEEYYDYDFIIKDSVFANILKPYYYPDVTSPSYYFFNIYFHETGKNFLKRKIEKTYDQTGSNPVVKATLYEYNQINELLKSTTDSLGY